METCVLCSGAKVGASSSVTGSHYIKLCPPAFPIHFSPALSLPHSNFIFTNDTETGFYHISWPLNTAFSCLWFPKKGPSLLSLLPPRPSWDLCSHAQEGPPALRGKGPEMAETTQSFPEPCALWYCMAKRYTSEDSFLLASGFTVLTHWNSPASLS